MTPIIERLQKLLNHERSARTIGNMAEAEAFAAKISEMLFAHKLSMSEVEIAEGERNEPVEEEFIEGFSAPWAGTLAAATGKTAFCRILKSSKGYIFIGRFSDRAAATAIYRHLAVLGVSLADSELAAYRETPEGVFEFLARPKLARTWKVSFLRGYALAIYRRVDAERKVLTAQAQSSGTSLVFIDKSNAAIQQFVDQKYPRLHKTYNNKSNLHGGAYRSGQRHGAQVSLKGSGALGAGR